METIAGIDRRLPNMMTSQTTTQTCCSPLWCSHCTCSMDLCDIVNMHTRLGNERGSSRAAMQCGPSLGSLLLRWTSATRSGEECHERDRGLTLISTVYLMLSTLFPVFLISPSRLSRRAIHRHRRLEPCSGHPAALSCASRLSRRTSAAPAPAPAH